jgi:hypothetical protein
MKTFSLSALANYRTTIFGCAAATLSYLVQQHIGNVGLEQALLSLSLMLAGASAADAAHK